MSIQLSVTVGGNLSVATAITASRTSAFAPAGIQFTVDASDANKRNLRFKWTYDRTHTYSLLESTRLSGRDGNVSYGPVGAATFEAGAYDVTCEIHDGTNSQVLTKTVTITSADSEFPTTDTICIDAGSSWTGAPTGAQKVTTWAAALSALNTNNGGRILFNKGDTYGIGNALVALYGSNWNGTSSANKVAFGAYGPGSAKPIIDQSGGGYFSFNNLENVSNVISISGIEFLGEYSATAGTGTITTGGSRRPDGISVGGSTEGHITIHDCKFSKLRQCISSISADSTDLETYISECEITEWEDYGIWHRIGNVSVYGCSIKQHLQARNGSENKQLGSAVNYPDHGCMRMSDNWTTCIYKNDLFSRNGWSSGGKAWQPNIRLNTLGKAGGDTAVSENQCEGSGVGHITNSSQNGSTTNEVATAWVCEKNHLIGSTVTYRMFALGKGNTVIRNNIFVEPNVAMPPTPPLQFSKFIDVDPDGPMTSANLAAPILIENNAFIDLRTNANGPNESLPVGAGMVASAGWSDFTERSNIFHAPNRNSPAIVSNLNATDVFVPLCDGHRLDTSVPSDPTPGGVGSTASYKPSTGSEAIGTTTSPNSAVDDFDGSIRSTVVGGLTRTTFSDGPFEPALES